MYDDVINDPKVLSLPDAMRWAWVAVLCAASKTEGVLPSTDHLGLMLRVTKQRAAAIIATLHAAGLLDKIDGGFSPHNWNGRQYKSDVSTERVKRFRDSKRNVSSAVSETAPETEQIQIVVADDARKPLVGVEAMDLAEQLMVIAGHDPGFWPPGWCGAPMRVQTWLNQNWPSEIIVAATKSAAARKHGAPAASVQFFEKAIAEEIARQAAPVPQVEVRQPDKITVNAHGKTQAGNIIQAANRLVDTIRSFDAGPGEADGLRGGTGAADVRLLSQG